MLSVFINKIIIFFEPAGAALLPGEMKFKRRQDDD
jgi:hypothetical protein